ncbi:MAG: nucleotide exchange factor GrpE [Candidatus Peregrinibacteria bacterium]
MSKHHDPLQDKIKQAAKDAKKKDQIPHEEPPPTQTDLQQMTEMAKRAMADLQNLKRRHEEEKQSWTSFANTDLIQQLLPILDNLDRALTHTPKDTDKEWVKGIEMAINQLHQVLNASDLTIISAEKGAAFDPNFHEAVAQGSGENNTITEVLEKGYMLGNRVIRHTKVKVGNGEK